MTFKLTLKSIVPLTFLASFTLCNSALASLDYSAKSVVFAAQGNSQQTITYTNNNVDDISIVQADFTTVINNANYTVDFSNCAGTTLAQDDSCTVYIDYTNNLAGKQSAYYQLTSPDDGTKLPIFALNYFDETNAAEANRRISPIVEMVEILNDDGSLASVDSGLIANTPYKIKWTVMSYGRIKGRFYLLNCTNEAVQANCATTSDSQSVITSEELDGVLLSDAEATNAGYEIYYYADQKATHQEFISASFQVDSATIGAQEYLGLRFYSRTEASNSLGDITNVSTLLSSSLDIQSQGTNSYLGDDGRRIKIILVEQP
ncbi:hypothetical protein RI844_02560 [Thalassotalea fonticola]|uniref:Uncharacterized protein n=1 Tax=Thalassotalea fonticola TaxID=3065649 RepID=A0ABZ0GRW1_9GAMM|nr:hypothetical protein RI844_02560 [Colwelliaceae bacterium S1-1]